MTLRAALGPSCSLRGIITGGSSQPGTASCLSTVFQSCRTRGRGCRADVGVQMWDLGVCRPCLRSRRTWHQRGPGGVLGSLEGLTRQVGEPSLCPGCVSGHLCGQPAGRTPSKAVFSENAGEKPPTCPWSLLRLGHLLPFQGWQWGLACCEQSRTLCQPHPDLVHYSPTYRQCRQACTDPRVWGRTREPLPVHTPSYSLSPHPAGLAACPWAQLAGNPSPPVARLPDDWSG